MKELLVINFESKVTLDDNQMLDLLDSVFDSYAEIVFLNSRENAESDNGKQYSAILKADDNVSLSALLLVTYILANVLKQDCIAYMTDEEEYGFIGSKPYEIFNKEQFFI